MKNISLLFFTFLLVLSLSNVSGQTTNDRLILGRKYAETEVKAALSDNPGHSYIDNKREIISDSSTAVQVAEPILFNIYGKDNIKKQKPYEIYHIDNYWLITGTLPKKMVGGTFLIIIDSRDSRIIRLTHGK